MLSCKSTNVKKTLFIFIILVVLVGICLGVLSICNFFDNSENKMDGIIKEYNMNKGVFNNIELWL